MKPIATLISFSVFTACSILLNNAEASMENGICDHSVAVSEKEIMSFILNNYSKDARPRKNASVPVEVSLSFRIRAIHDLIEKDNTLILDAYIYANWFDDYLAWDFMFPFSCFPQLVVPPSSTWIPDISLINAPNGIYSLMMAPGFSIYVSSNGAVEYAPGGQIVTTCEVDVTYFPFDRQVCYVNFEAWNYDTTAQVFKLDEKHPFVKVQSSWTENRQWSVEANYSQLKLVNYLEASDYAHVSYTLVLRRKSLYYYVNIIVPSIIISVVEMATFALPIYEVIKIHISFTCLLAYSVFQGMVIADLPRSGETVPLLSLYIDLQMAYIGLIALMGEAVVLMILQKGQRKQEFPSLKLLAAFRVIGRIVLVENNLREIPKRREKIDEEGRSIFSIIKWAKLNFLPNGDAKSIGNRKSSQVDKFAEESPPNNTLAVDNSQQDERPSGEMLQHWMFIAEVIARINLILYTAAITATPVVMFIMFPREEIGPKLACI